MKIDFANPSKQYSMEYCINCHSTNIKHIKKDGQILYECSFCGKVLPRAIIIDPLIQWWIDPFTKEYWHKSVGVFIFNDKEKFLTFKLNKYPYKLTVPAGHLNISETPEEGALREMIEETSLMITSISFLGEDDIKNDSCRRGSDHHRWFTFKAFTSNTHRLNINEEGVEPMWVSTDEAENLDFTIPVQFVFQKYKSKFLNPQ